MPPTINSYRNFLQARANSGDSLAAGLLNLAGDDGKLNDVYVQNGQNIGQGGATYTRQNVISGNNSYYKQYQDLAAHQNDAGGSPAVAPTNNTTTAPAAVDPGYDLAIGNTNAAIGRLGGQQQAGYGTIDSSFQDALSQLLLGKNQAETAKNKADLGAKTGYVGAKNAIGAGAGAALNGIRRLLGSRGAAGGSADRIAAPDAVSRQATLQRNDAGNTFAGNEDAINTNWGNYLTGYNNEVSSAGKQRDTARQTLDSTIANNKASLLQQLAQLTLQKTNNPASAAPFLDQANKALDSVNNVTTTPINYNTTAYQAPSLASYNTSGGPAPTFQGQSATNDYFSPFLQGLLGKKQPANVAA